MEARSLIAIAKAAPEWTRVPIHDGASVINATVKSFDFDVHDYPETLISLSGAYAIETPHGEIAIAEGSAFTVPPGLKHRPANRQPCVILVLG